MGKALVAFFSASGVTKELARKLARVVKADLLEIVPEVPYTPADLDWRDANARSTIEMKDPDSRPEIAGFFEGMEAYDILFVGFPIWWYVAPTIINTFLEQYDLTGKTLIPFATSGGSGMGRTNGKLLPSCPGAKLMEGKVLDAGISEEELKAWIRELL